MIPVGQEWVGNWFEQGAALYTGSLTLPVPGRLARATLGDGHWCPRWVARWFPVAQTACLACRGSLAHGPSSPTLSMSLWLLQSWYKTPGKARWPDRPASMPPWPPMRHPKEERAALGPAAPTEHSLKLSRTFAVNQVGENRGRVWCEGWVRTSGWVGLCAPWWHQPGSQRRPTSSKFPNRQRWVCIPLVFFCPPGLLKGTFS